MISFESGFIDGPSVLGLANELGVTENEVIGGLIRLAVWVERHNANLSSLTADSLSSIMRIGDECGNLYELLRKARIIGGVGKIIKSDSPIEIAVSHCEITE